MRRQDSRRALLLILLALILISGALAVYSLVLYRWLWHPPARSLPAGRGALGRRLEDLATARGGFREKFLDPKSHLRLAEALYRANRPADAFYVMLFARDLFKRLEFSRAHEQIILGQGQNPELAAYKAQLSAADPAQSVPILAKLAQAAPDSFEGRSAVEELSRLARKSEFGPSGESAYLSREALEALLRAQPRNPQIFSALVLSLWDRSEKNSVRAVVAETLSRYPQHAGARQLEGVLALEDGQTDKAVQAFTLAWENNPNDLFSARKLAQIHYKQRAFPEAALPFYFALYRQNPSAIDGEPVETILRRIWDVRAAQTVRAAGPAALEGLLRSEDASLRAQACAKAAELKASALVPLLAELLDDDVEIVRHNADYALYQIAQINPQAILSRRQAWLSQDKLFAHARALGLFADLDPRATLPLAIRALKDTRPAVRYLAKTLVFDHYYKNDPRAAAALAEHLNEEKDPLILALYRRGK
ncbi:MAG: hypothetical protein HY921_06155 [Elusimicrobia bacterium]|nr:hypothetical protein [Elusimicrobiota bacterium]